MKPQFKISFIVLTFALLACACPASDIAKEIATAVADEPTAAVATRSTVPTTRPNTNTTATPAVATGPVSDATLKTLQNANIPINDLRLLAMRLKGVADIPATVTPKAGGYKVGEEEKFWVSNQDTNAHFQITARLVYATDNVYFFVNRDLQVNESDVKKLVDTFQTKIYATDRKFFGSEPNPGVDGDPHMFILYTRGLGSGVGGYASSADGYSRLAQQYSNEKEIFYINAEAYRNVSNPDLPGTLAHEFQHMIHGYQDSNEDTWMNEGYSMVAEFLNNYRTGHESAFVVEPDLQLNAWGESGASNNIPHYGASFMFLTYVLDRFGEDTTKAIIANKENGLQAMDEAFTQLKLTDKTTGKPITAVDVFADWVIANYVGDKNVGDGRYVYNNYPQAPKVTKTSDSISTCPTSTAKSATVHQFGADYIRLSCAGAYTLNFTGAAQVNVISANAHGGKNFMWSNRGDKSDTTLTREFDLTNVKTATFKYWAWWELEDDYDFAYIEASTDGGKTWKIIKTPNTTDTNPSGNNFGWGYNASSGGGKTGTWLEETVDLKDYVGKKVQLRFEYITDDAVTRNGLALDDLSLAELNYKCDFETDDCGWKAEGFVRIDNVLPQTFAVQLIRRASGKTTVERIALEASNAAAVKLDLAAGETAVLVVSGTTKYTTQLANYKYEITK